MRLVVLVRLAAVVGGVACLQPHALCCCSCAEAILLVDVDFAVSRSLADTVADEESYGRLMAMLHAR